MQVGSHAELAPIQPRYGSVYGGEKVVFNGENLNGSGVEVFIDDKPCTISKRNNQKIECTTADRPFVEGLEPKLSIYVDGKGYAATRGQVYRYVSKWSDKRTWGNDLLPVEGEALVIPAGQHLLVDVPVVPRLSFALVQGSLIFDSEERHWMQRTFDADHILVYGGYMEIGTEEAPYTSKLTITLHGDETDPYLPVFGNKVLGVLNGQLEMHGKPRDHVWSELYETADVGAKSIVLNIPAGSDFDWAVGEKIVIASTDFDGTHAEEREIIKVEVDSASGNRKVSFADELLYKHYAGVQTFGDEQLEMRAEVGLLSRNVVFRGDEQTSSQNKYGAQIMLSSHGNESSIGRIENCELFDVGQAFKLARYPIHFHMLGNVNKSYIKNNSIHQTYNRATTLHGVHYLTVSGNVAYKTMGHAIFLEDAIETNNLIENNLVIDVRASNSLLNTD